MAIVLVTGGTGALGTHLVPVLLDRGHEVRVLSRSAQPNVPVGVSTVQGDVRTGAGVADAVAGVDAVVHAASSPFRRTRATEVGGTRHLLDAVAAAQVPHLVYVSIVGADRIRLGYYRAKVEAERLVEAHTSGWTIQRATQFHSLLDTALSHRISARTKHLAFQPIAERDVSARLADLVASGPRGRAVDIGGPEVLSMGDLRDQRAQITGRRTALVPVPAVGPLKGLDAGNNLAPEERYGSTTWAEWLRARQDER